LGGRQSILDAWQRTSFSHILARMKNTETEFQQIIGHKRRVARKIEDLDDETLKAISLSTVPSEFASLDKLIEDWKP
jgi:hypothetical protein